MQFISLKAPCCLPHLNGVTGAVSCTGDVLVSRSTRAGGWAYLGDLFHNCRPCRSVLSIPFGITLGSHRCTRLERIDSCLHIRLVGLCWEWESRVNWRSIGRKSDVVKELSCTDMGGHCLWMTLWGYKRGWGTARWRKMLFSLCFYALDLKEKTQRRGGL